MTIAFIQAKEGGTNASSLVITPMGDTVAGSLLVMAMGYQNFHTVTITDNKSNVWLEATAAKFESSTISNRIFYCPSAAAGTNSLTISLGTSTPIQAVFMEFSGVKAATPVDTANVNDSSASSTTPVSPNLTPSVANDLFVTGIYPLEATFTNPAITTGGWTAYNTISENGYVAGWFIATDSSAQQATFNSANQKYVSNAAAFLAATATNPELPTTLTLMYW